MSGRVWELRPLRRGDWEFVVDGRVAGLVSLHDGIDRPSSLARRLLEAVAAHHDDRTSFDQPSQVDWAALGWSSAAEHHELVDQVARLLDAWRGHPLEKRCLMHVVARKQAAGIPAHPPYSVSELDELDRIVRTAPDIVAQDVAAERTDVA